MSLNSQIELRCPSEPASVTALRHKAASFAAEQGAGSEPVSDVNLAVSEAVTNAVKYGDETGGGGSVGLAGSSADGWLEFRITDEGERFGKGSPDGLGLGLAIIARLCDDLRIVQEGAGTTVLMRFALR
jgi:anti-sigma regulatory factor (Ser/Thr protein kinase)